MPGDLQNRETAMLTRSGDEPTLVSATLYGTDVMVKEVRGGAGGTAGHKRLSVRFSGSGCEGVVWARASSRVQNWPICAWLWNP